MKKFPEWLWIEKAIADIRDSLRATTPEMLNKGTNNIVGATILTLYLDKKNRIIKTERMFLNYRTIIPDDYKAFRSLTEHDKKLVKELRG